MLSSHLVSSAKNDNFLIYNLVFSLTNATFCPVVLRFIFQDSINIVITIQKLKHFHQVSSRSPSLSFHDADSILTCGISFSTLIHKLI